MSGFVYFIGPEALLHRSNTVVKIGYTRKDPKARLAALQTGSPEPLVLWAYTPGGPELEKAFHDTFAELRSHGEWFFVQRKLWHFLGYLGSEPHIGRCIPRGQMEIAILDNIFCEVPPGPEVTAEEWNASARPECLANEFTEIWFEACEG